MFSVTSETAANLCIQNAPSRSARTDPSPAPDSFSALIDSNTAAGPASNDRPAAATAPDRPLQQRPDDASADSRQLRDDAASGNATANTPSQDVQSSAAPSVTADGGADSGVTAKPKLESVKSGIVKTTVKDAASDIIASPPDTAAASDAAASPQPAAATAVPPAPVVVAIAMPVAATGVVIAPASNGNATEPLAIAAAAIATSTSTVEASKPAVTSAQAPIDPATNAPASPTPVAAASPIAAPATPAMTSPAVPDRAAPAVNTPQAATPDTVVVPVNRPVPKADTPIQADPESAAPVAVASPVAPVASKATANTSTSARGSENAAPIKPGIASNAAGPSAAEPSLGATGKSVAPQSPAADGKQKADGIAVDVAKTDAAGTNAPTTAALASPHEHRAAAAAQVQAEPSDAGQAANAVQQPQVQSATTPAAAAPWSVTAATSAAVPLNGLALQIAVSAQSGKSRFEIRLDPAELGRIDVRIDVDRHGQLTSHLTVEKPETLAMLRQDAPQLQRALDNAGFKTGDSGLQFSLRDQSSSGQNSGNEAGRHAQRLIISEDDSVAAAVAGRTYGRMPGSSSGVDIRV